MTAVAAPLTRDVGRARRRFVRHPAWLVAPLLIVFVLAFLYPLLRMGEVALLRGDVVANVARLFDTPLYVRVLGRTFQTALMVALVTVALAYPLAAFISRRSDRVQALLIVLLFVPMLTSVVVRAYSWVAILRPNGVLDGIANLLGLPSLGGAFYQNEAGILIGMVHLMLPFAALPLVRRLFGASIHSSRWPRRHSAPAGRGSGCASSGCSRCPACWPRSCSSSSPRSVSSSRRRSLAVLER